jgi:hypothetical protein
MEPISDGFQPVTNQCRDAYDRDWERIPAQVLIWCGNYCWKDGQVEEEETPIKGGGDGSWAAGRVRGNRAEASFKSPGKP